MIYKIFTYPCADRSRLAIRLTKAHNAHMTRTKVMYSDTTGDKLNPVNTRNTEGPAFLKKHYLRKFNEVGERMPHCGVFVSGKRPFFVIMAKSGDESIKDFDVIQDDEEEGDGEEAATGVAGSSGKKTSLSSVPQNTSHVPAAQRQGDMSIYIHPAIMDGNVLCFADFHNINCRKGFVYFTQQVIAGGWKCESFV